MIYRNKYGKIYEMKELGLFDDIKYNYIKDIDDDEDVDVEIEPLNCDRVGWRKSRFTFDLTYLTTDVSDDIKKFVVEKEYDSSIQFGLLCIIWYFDDENEDKDESNKKIFTIGKIITDSNDPKYDRHRTFKIEKITKCYIYWCELHTNCWNNNNKIFRKKKRFCPTKNCEYFLDNLGSSIYADGSHY
jgi:hypothetical protein